MLRVGLIGCGRQGWRRANAVKACGDLLVIVTDVEEKSARALAEAMNCQFTTDRLKFLAVDVDAIIVTTPNDSHAAISLEALRRGRHVLCEKPLGLNPNETAAMVEASEKTGLILKCRFNLRHHPGIKQARIWFDRGEIGEPLFVRIRYGIGGRIDYERDWRMNRRISGGGQLMDQGMHALDLARWFLGEFSESFGVISASFWKTQVEDNAFCLLQTEEGKTASIHASWTQWKNLFSLEIYGAEGYITVEGLGRSYGTEKAILGKRNFTKPFEEIVVEFRGEDSSWAEEWKEFTSAIKEGREPLGSARDGHEAVKLAYNIYTSADEKRTVRK
jgi:predicted dehydrogenase